MKQREKRNIIIGILCCMVVFMSVGYAVLSQTLKINGTANITGSWDIYIESITFNESESSSTTRGTGSVDQADKTKASYSAELLKPQDVVVYDVVVANAGTIDAVLNDLVIDPTDTEYFTFETIGIAKGDELPAQTGDSPTTRSFKIKVTFKDSVTEANMPEKGTEVKGLIKLDYVQKTTTNFGTESVPGGGDFDIEGEEPAITVDENGTVVSYNKEKLTNSEGYVVIPATTEKGEEIVSIDALSFTKLNAANVYAYNDTTSEEVEGYIIYDEENYDTIKSILLDDLESSGSGSGSYSSSSTLLGKNINPTNMVTKESDTELTKKMSGSGSESDEEVLIYTKAQFDAMISQMGGKEEVVVELEYMYIDLETGERADGEDALVMEGVMAPIEKLDLSNAVHLKKIGDFSFAGSSLKEIKLGNTIEEIGESAFASAKLTSLTLPNSLKIIGGVAFEFNELSDAIIIPESVTSIGNGFIDGNCNLKKIIIKRANGEGITFGKDWLGSAEKYCGTGAVTPEVIYDPNYVG